MSGSKNQPEPKKNERTVVQPPSVVHDDKTRVDVDSTPDLHGIVPERPKTLEQFIQLLTASKLVTAHEFAEVMGSLSPDKRPADAASAAHMLVEHELLTFYQASVLLDGRARGLVLGAYVILEKIGEGGMGMVFKARHQRMKRIVALKILPPSMTSSADAINRFHREVEVAARLQHPNIAAAFDAGEAQGIHFLVMEYVDGPNLSSYVKQSGPLPIAVATNLALQTARGLAHAHEQSVVHRDIKPGNLLVDSSGNVKILDMGLATLGTAVEVDEEQQELTQSGRVMGTVDYMAPEQAVDAKTVDHRADIYSLGCTLHYLLTARPMAPEGTLAQKLLWHQSEPIPTLNDLTTSVPPFLDKTFQRMLAKSPSDRQDSMMDVVQQLEDALDEMSATNLELEELGISLNLGSPATDIGTRGGATVVERPTKTDMGPIDLGQKKSSGRSISLIAVLAGAALLLMAAGLPFLWPAKPTQIEFVNLPSDATLLVNGATIPHVRPTGMDSFLYNVSEPGKYIVEVSRQGFEEFRTNIEVARGELQSVDISLVESPVSPGPDEPGPSIETENPNSVASHRGNNNGDSVDEPGGQTGDDTHEGIAGGSQANSNGAGEANNGTDNNGTNNNVANGGGTNGDGTNGGGTATPVVEESPKKKPHEDLLVWLFENDARVGLTSGEEIRVVDDLSDVPEAFQVESIRLHGADIGDGDIERLKVFDQTLLRLDLGATKITDQALDNLAELPALQVLDVSNTKVSNSGLAGLSRLSNLRSLDLKDTAVTTQGLTLLLGLQRLEELNLSDTNVGDSAVPKIAGFPALKEVQLFGTSITQNGVLRIKELRPNLAVIWDGVDIERKVAQQLLDRGATLALMLRSGELIEDVVDAVALPSKRFAIDEVVAGSQFGNQDLQRLSLLVSLRRLDLADSRITSFGLKLLYPVASLEEIELGTLTLTDESVSALRRSLPDCDIHLKETNDRLAARWTISQGGALDLTTPDGARHAGIRDVSDIPEGRFSIVRVDLSKVRNLAAAQLMSLTELQFLESVLLNDTGVGDDVLEVVLQCPKLRDLRLAGTSVTSTGVGGLVGNEELKLLVLPSQSVNAASMEVICGLPTIEQLALAGAKLDATTFAKLRQLKKLNGLILDDAPLTDEHVAVLRRIKTLTNLSIRRTGVTDLAVETLELALQQCRVQHDPLNTQRLASRWVLQMGGIVTLADGPITKVTELPHKECVVVGIDLTSLTSVGGSSFAKHLPNLTSLRELNLSNTDVGDREMAAVARMQGLESLVLRNVPVSDGGIQQLSPLKSLKSLDLTGTLVMGTLLKAGGQSLGFANALTSLGLGGTRVTDKSVRFVEQFPNLVRLDVSRTDISADTLASLKKTLPKCTVIGAESQATAPN